MDDSGARTTTIYMNEEDQLNFKKLMEQTSLTRSALVRRLVLKELFIREEGSQSEEVIQHVSALAKIFL
jgi:hypothetical protein